VTRHHIHYDIRYTPISHTYALLSHRGIPLIEWRCILDASSTYVQYAVHSVVAVCFKEIVVYSSAESQMSYSAAHC
jgi:hypothetical protein